MTQETRTCENPNCETVLTEGYVAEWCAMTFCSIGCAEEILNPEDIEEGLEDESFYWTEFVDFATIENPTDAHKHLEVFSIHDNLYLTQALAEQFNDGKDRVTKLYALLRPYETFYEGTQADTLTFDTLDQLESFVKDDQ